MSNAGDKLREAAQYLDEAALAAQRGDAYERDRLLGRAAEICAMTVSHIERMNDPLSQAIALVAHQRRF